MRRWQRWRGQRVAFNMVTVNPYILENDAWCRRRTHLLWQRRRFLTIHGRVGRVFTNVCVCSCEMC